MSHIKISLVLETALTHQMQRLLLQLVTIIFNYFKSNINKNYEIYLEV